jgi:signal transduction histidine kinase
MKTRILFGCFLIAGFLTSAIAQTQDPAIGKYNNTAKVRSSAYMYRKTSMAYVSESFNITRDFKKLKMDSIQRATSIQPDKVNKKIVAHFQLSNSIDSTFDIVFYPGFYFKEFDLYKEIDGKLIAIKPRYPIAGHPTGYRLIKVEKNDSISVWAFLKPARTSKNIFSPQLIVPSFVRFFDETFNSAREGQDFTTIFFIGVLAMLTFFGIFGYIFRQKKSGILYASYTGSLLFLFLLWGTQWQVASTFSYFSQEYLAFYVQTTGFLLYSLFIIEFLKTKTNHPGLHKILFTNAFINILVIVTHAFTQVASIDFVITYYIEFSSLYIQELFLLLFIVYAFKKRTTTPIKYLFWGNLSLFILGIVSINISIFDFSLYSNTSFWANGLLYYEAGLFIELVLFQYALYKRNMELNKQSILAYETLKTNAILMEYEKEIAILNAQKTERKKIAEGLQEKLSEGLVDIQFTSEMAKKRSEQTVKEDINKISQTAERVIANMNDLIWILNSTNDTTKKLTLYLKNYATDYFKLTKINCTITVTDQTDDEIIDGEKRRNLFTKYRDCLEILLKDESVETVSISICTTDSLTIKIISNQQHNWILTL